MSEPDAVVAANAVASLIQACERLKNIPDDQREAAMAFMEDCYPGRLRTLLLQLHNEALAVAK